MKVRNPVKDDVTRLQKDIRSLRDEIRVMAHLGRMDLKSEWQKLGPRAEKALHEVSNEAIAAAKELKDRFAHLRKELKRN